MSNLSADCPEEDDTIFTYQKDLSTRYIQNKASLNVTGLLAHWNFNEKYGFEMHDQSGNDFSAYLTGYVWNTNTSGLTSHFHRKGKRHGSISLGGKEWLQVKHSDQLNLNENFSIAAWINLSDIHKSVIVEKGTPDNGYSLFVNPLGELVFRFSGHDEGPKFIKSKNNIIQPERWYFVGVLHNSDKKHIQLFLNDSIIKEKSYNQQVQNNTYMDLTIGGSLNDSLCFNGLIDEVSVYERVLNKSELRSIYISGLPVVYAQTRETIDDSLSVWTHFHGNEPVPHPVDSFAVLNLRFDGNMKSVNKDFNFDTTGMIYQPGFFRGSWDASSSGSGFDIDFQEKHPDGTLEAWIELLPLHEESTTFMVLYGMQSNLELSINSEEIILNHLKNGKVYDSFKNSIEELNFHKVFHLALTWQDDGHSTIAQVFVNGVETSQRILIDSFQVSSAICIGGTKTKAFQGLVDDLCLSGRVKKWGEICPRGIVSSGVVSMDVRTSFDDKLPGAMMHWKSVGSQKTWKICGKEHDASYESPAIYQFNPYGVRLITHPDAKGINSSLESVVSVDSIVDGWIGIFVNSPDFKSDSFSGHSFMINYKLNKLRLAIHDDGKIVNYKLLNNDFHFKPKLMYQLTLSFVNGMLKGFVDNRNVISMKTSISVSPGYAGLMTTDARAWFDDIHFNALTPPEEVSRKIMVRLIDIDPQLTISKPGLSAFRWEKRYGLLPWNRDYKNPEPPGNIFGPDEKTPRPNPSAHWRSEDAANSAVIHVNGTFYYFMRGNPDIHGMHGNAQIGVLWKEADEFDGLHFFDPALDPEFKKNTLLKGHRDTNKGGCHADPPRDNRFQLNDEGVVFINGKIIMVCREFRNSNPRSNKFKRLVTGIFDTETNSWTSDVPYLNDWSQMNPDSCYAVHRGLDATPEITLIRDPESDEFVVLLYHHPSDDFRKNNPSSGDKRYRAVSGFYFENNSLKKHPDYKERETISKPNRRLAFGERVFFDNGIWYMHVNAHSEGLRRDWPNQFHLYSSLHPYSGNWVESPDNHNKNRSYFTRGDEFDPDNGAIWQGEVLKYRNHYYMYYENYHVIDNTETMYEHYNHPQSGSRVGYAIAN